MRRVDTSKLRNTSSRRNDDECEDDCNPNPIACPSCKRKDKKDKKNDCNTCFDFCGPSDCARRGDTYNFALRIAQLFAAGDALGILAIIPQNLVLNVEVGVLPFGGVFSGSGEIGLFFQILENSVVELNVNVSAVTFSCDLRTVIIELIGTVTLAVPLICDLTPEQFPPLIDTFPVRIYLKFTFDECCNLIRIDATFDATDQVLFLLLGILAQLSLLGVTIDLAVIITVLLAILTSDFEIIPCPLSGPRGGLRKTSSLRAAPKAKERSSKLRNHFKFISNIKAAPQAQAAQAPKPAAK